MLKILFLLVHELIELETNSEAEIFSRPDAQDKIYTQAEAESTCGPKTQELTREKSTQKPCGARTRQLTREEPLPQSIYRVKTQTGRLAVAFIKLNACRKILKNRKPKSFESLLSLQRKLANNETIEIYY